MKAQLIAAFEESLALAPEPAEVLAGMRAGIRRRRRRVRVTTAVLAVLALAAGAVTVGTLRDRPAPAGSTQPAGSTPAAQWRGTIAAGWVPPGLVPVEVNSNVAAESLVYHADGAHLVITVNKQDVNPKLDAEGWQAKEIFGRPGRERTEPGRALVGRALPSGHWADVTFERQPGGGLTDAELLAGAERVAGSLRDDVDVPLRVDIAPTYLPEGVHVTGVGAYPPAPGRGSVTCTGGPDTWVTIAYTPMNLLEGGERIDDIQGRPAYLLDNRKTVVVNAYHDAMLAVWGSGVPVEELIRIAEGVRWLG